MKIVSRFASAALIALAVAMLGACGTSGGGNAGAGGAGGGGAATSLDVAPDGENLAFAQKTLSANSGGQVTVNFKDVSTANQHNWVLVKGGDDVAQKVADEGATAGPDKGYIPDDATNIVAHTKLVNPGSSDTATFTAPAAGTYTYLCTVAGHYAAGMKGTLTVK